MPQSFQIRSTYKEKTMNQRFVLPGEYIYLDRGNGNHLDVAFLPIPVRMTQAECASYLKHLG